MSKRLQCESVFIVKNFWKKKQFFFFFLIPLSTESNIFHESSFFFPPTRYLNYGRIVPHRVCIAKLISIGVRLKMIYINLSINHAYLHNNESMKLIPFQNNCLFKFQSVMYINQFLSPPLLKLSVYRI